MHSNTLQLITSSNKSINLERASAKMKISEVFNAKTFRFINEYTLFTFHFNLIPNYSCTFKIDFEKAVKWFSKNYETEIKEIYYSDIYIVGKNEAIIDEIYYFLYEDLIVYFNNGYDDQVAFLYRNTDLQKVDEVIKNIQKFKRRKQKHKPEVSLLVNGHNGITTKSLEISKPKLSIDDNYNDDFKEVHRTISKRLSIKNDKGIVLLHGKPGTGKTSYIRYLITSLKKNVIFLPPNMASAITNPSLISILIDNPNSVFVIEDAENIVIDRNRDGNSSVSALLNISDGLLADCLNVQIICSFNTDISRIDNALMRKGRLIAKYEFKELEIEKAQMLSNKLGFKSIITNPMSLASIYNQAEKEFQQIKKINPIGFQAINLDRLTGNEI